MQIPKGTKVMKVEIVKGRAEGSVSAPPSKSAAHRALICSAFCEKEITEIKGIYPSEDILATIDCLKAFGAEIDIEKDVARIKGVNINACKGGTLLCRESGSTLRFFIPLCAINGKSFTLKGSEKLISRPLSVYEELFAETGIFFEKHRDFIEIKGKAEFNEITVDPSLSSQFVTGLMFYSAVKGQRLIINAQSDFTSKPYIEMTAEILKKFGVKVSVGNDNVIVDGLLRSPKTFEVEGDWSGAAFFEAFNFIGSKVEVKGLNYNSFQGDKAFMDICSQTGKIEADLTDTPDLAPILFSLAAAKKGGVFYGTERLSYKESDRGLAMKEELEKFGTEVVIEKNKITVNPKAFHRPDEVLFGHNDHRIVMALSVLLTLTGGEINGAEAVSKSMPDFFEKLESLGIEVKK